MKWSGVSYREIKIQERGTGKGEQYIKRNKGYYVALPYAGDTYLYKRGYRRVDGSSKQTYQNDNTENGRAKTKHNTHKLGNFGYGIYENCVLCNSTSIIGEIPLLEMVFFRSLFKRI